MKRVKATIRLLLFYAALNTAATVIIDKYINELTGFEIILRIPNTFFWDFSK